MENGSPPVLPPGMGGEHAYDAEKVSIGAAFFVCFGLSSSSTIFGPSADFQGC